MVGRGIVVLMVVMGVFSGSAAAQNCGDPDGSGAITVTDGIQALRGAAGLESSCSNAACDVDRSGTVSVTDGVLILRLAAGLAAPAACTDNPLGVAMRQAVNNNPYRGFGDLTKAATESRFAAGRFVEPIAIADTGAGDIRPAASVGDGIACPVSGFQALVGCQQAVIGNVDALISTIQFEQCATQTAGGFIRQDGIIRETVPGASECILFTQSQLPINQEIIEERQGFTSEFFDGSGNLTERQVESIQQIIAYLSVCQGPLGARFPSNQRRQLSGTTTVATFEEEEPVVFSLTYSDVAFTRLYSDSCSTHTTTLQSGTVETSDQRFGETYSAGFDDVEYALTSRGSGLDLTLDGSLESSCGDDSETFDYQTLTASTFDPAGDGCPRGGTFEVKRGDEVLGQIAFSEDGGVTLTPAGGGPATTFASCNDPALLLSCE